MDYDILILGGGIVGCAAAYELSKYSLNIALIEKDYDIVGDVDFINYNIIYDGLESQNNTMCKLEMMGNSIIKEVANKFNVNYRKCGYLIVAEDENREENINKIYSTAIDRGIKDIHILDDNEVIKIEPNFNTKVKKAIYSKNAGIIMPYDLAIAYGEIAFDNGVNFKLQEEVIDIQKMSKGFKVITNKNKFTCNMVLNTIPKENYSIGNFSKLNKENYDMYNFNKLNKHKSNLKYFLLEKGFQCDIKNIVSILEKDGDRISIIPTIEGEKIISIRTDKDIDCEESLKKIEHIVGKINVECISAFYESQFYKDNLIIDDSLIDKGYIKILGKHYSCSTVAPAIAKIVCESIVNNLKCVLKKDFVDKRREFYRFRDLSNEKRNEIIHLNKKYGKIICSCKNITEGEIIDSIRRPLGARTIEGVKRRTGVTFGNCMGIKCLSKIASILARETDKKMTDIVKDSKNSNIMISRIKEFDTV